ncbi:MAG: cytochrome c [Candidatus Angelobacter sp.]
MRWRPLIARAWIAGAVLASAPLSGCNNLPGRPKPGAEVQRPEQVLSFDLLYQQNCAGCHGTQGENGPATDLANPEYEALIDDASLRNVIANGQKGAMMPGFAKAAGGPLTDQQVDVIFKGMRARWSRGNVLQGLNVPPYKIDKPGNPSAGQQVYANACARCHGPVNGPPGKVGSILNDSLLALISEQTVRTTVIAGRPDLKMPDWRNQIRGHPLSNQEIADVVAWVMAQRPQPAGPYPAANPAAAKTSTGGK